MVKENFFKIELKYKLITAALSAILAFVLIALMYRYIYNIHSFGLYAAALALATALGVFIGFYHSYMVEDELLRYRGGIWLRKYPYEESEFTLERLTGFSSLFSTLTPQSYRLLVNHKGKQRKVILFMGDPKVEKLVSQLEQKSGKKVYRRGV